MSQIMNLLNLAPDIQESLLFLPEVGEGKVVVTERKLRKVMAEWRWSKQRAVWRTHLKWVASKSGPM